MSPIRSLSFVASSRRGVSRPVMAFVIMYLLLIQQLVAFAAVRRPEYRYVLAPALTGVSLTSLGTAYTQNFDTLSNTAGSTTNSLTIVGWYLTEGGGGTRDNEQYAVDTGGSNTGDTYSYGAAGSTDRALGGLRSGTLVPVFGAAFTNNTGATVNSLNVAYTGEEWRLGTAGRTDQINFEYSINATDLSTGTWTNVPALNFVTPDTATTGAKNGNAAAERTALSSTISGLNIPNGATVWVRWTDTDASGADDGLAVDDFSITPNGVAGPPTLSVNDVSLNEGNSGTTNFNFTVGLSAAAGPGGVTFDIATADGTAASPTDYTANSLPAQTIPAGSTSYSFSVAVNGDTTPEPDETFFVNVTNVTGANVADGQGQGTIVNDDAAPTAPSGNGTANPSSLFPGDATSLTVTVTPGANPTSTGLGVTADLSSIGGSASQAFSGSGNTFTFNATVANATTPGTKTLPFTITDGQSRTGSGSITVTVNAPPPPNNVVISQVYGGGGNTGSTLKNDYIELINRSDAPVSLNGWSVQVFSTTNSTWDVTPLTNVSLQPGQYYLVQESQGAGGTDDLPPADATGGIFVSSTSSKVALVNNAAVLTGACPTGAGIVDFVGYGSQACFEGSGPAPTLSNTTAALRLNEGCFDTNDNAADFVSGEPNPHNTSSPTHDCTGISGFGSANPSTVLQGQSTTLTVRVAGGQNPASTGITVTGDLTPIGGSATQAFIGSGNTFTFTATVPANNSSGLKSLPITISDAQARSFQANIKLSVLSTIADHIVISQVYGGGGNGGATFTNDYVELYNPTDSSVTITGWTLQYSSAAGTSWTNNQPLGGTIGSHQYYLVQLGSGGSGGAPLPVTPNISGDINMSATNGKIVLVRNSDPLSGGCPIGTDPDIVDFLGYGGANCHEGNANATAPSSTTALFRKNGGDTDTDQNGNDFVTGTPNPRRTEPVVELGPWVAGTDPTSAGATVPHDATVTVNFSEPVDVDQGWFNLTCSITGSHNDATVAHTGDFKAYAITPNTNFQFGEQCSVTIPKAAIHDQDTDDSGPDTDTLFADYTWSFTVVAAGQPAPYAPSVHLTMGNPSCGSPAGCATADLGNPNNYLMEKPTYSLSYNRDKGTPNWVSWHLDSSWYGSLARVDTFRADPQVPADWYRVEGFDYSGSGFDRGHMTPNADRDNQNRVPINQETYLMSNMVPQAPDNNQGPWAAFEAYLRSLADAGNELYIVSGPAGAGGTGSNGFANTIANGHVTVPASTWKVVLVLPKGDDDVNRVTAATRTIAINIPNVQGIRNNDWTNYLTKVDDIESLTGYDFFANVPASVQNGIEAGTNGTNPPGTADQSVQTSEETPVQFALNAVNPTNTALTVTVTQGPTGSLSCSGITCTYTPPTDFTGTDTFQYRVSNGSMSSNESTVTVGVSAVNDAPSFNVGADQTVLEDAGAQTVNGFATNIKAGPQDESGQSVNFIVSNDNNSLFSVQPAIDESGNLTFTAAADTNGAATVSVTAKDNGGTANGGVDTSGVQTFKINVTAVNDAPSFTKGGDQTVSEDSGSKTVAGWATGISSGPADESGQTVSFVVSNNNNALFSAQPAVDSAGTLTYTPAANANGSAVVTVAAMDNGGTANGGADTSAARMFTITVNPVNDAPVTANDRATQSVQYSDAVQTVNISGTDIDSPTLTVSTSFAKDGGASQAGLPSGLSLSPGSCTPNSVPVIGAGSACTWTVSGTATLAPGSYVVTAKVSDGDAAMSTTSFTVVVTREDARATYTGTLFAATSSSSSTTATVTLAATIQDISAIAGDPDTLPGDIRNATVKFVNRDAGDATLCTANIGLVDVNDTKVGTATCNWTTNIGTNDSQNFTVGVVVDGYYSRDVANEDAIVTVSKPVPGLVSGGGYLLLANSGGQRAGDAGTKNNFGFNIKNDKNGPKGNINVIVRRLESDGVVHVYQIKGNAMTSLVSRVGSASNPGTATFNGKANIKDITDPLNVISIDGNASLQVVMTDGGDADSIAVTLWDKSGGLWFASSWDGVKTVEQALGGGNLQVR